MVFKKKPREPRKAGSSSTAGVLNELRKATVEASPHVKVTSEFMDQMAKRFGAGSVMVLDDEAPAVSIPVIPSGIPTLDAATGVGGLPEGRVIEMFGPESSGKTTLALIYLAHAQAQGKLAAFVDAEHALVPSWAQQMGVDLGSVLISQPDNGEQALEILELMILSGNVRFAVVDSVAALVPKAEIEGDMGDTYVGLQARLMSQAMRKLVGVCSARKATVIFINQLRQKIGVTFGNGETTTGGNALKFYASMRLDVRRVGALKTGDEITGSKVRIKVVKNKVAAPFKEAEVDLHYAFGLDLAADVLQVAVLQKVVTMNGAWYSFGEQRLGQGEEQAKATLRADPVLMAAVRAKL